MNIKEMERWLVNLPVLTDITDSEDEKAVNELLGGRGLTLLLGLMLGSRQAYYAQISRQRLGDGEADWRAGVTQGKIQGLELAIETVRQLAQPEEGPNGGAEQ